MHRSTIAAGFGSLLLAQCTAPLPLKAASVVDFSAPYEGSRSPLKTVQVNVDRLGHNIFGDAANEPSIVVDPTNPRRMAIGWRQFDSVLSDFRQAGYAYSRDGGHHWHFPGVLQPGVFGSDPVLDADADGVFYYVSFLVNYESSSPYEMRLFRSLDSGRSWGDPISRIPGLFDKPWIAIDRTEGIGRGNLYLGSAAGLRRSTDGGFSFSERLRSFGWGTLTVDTEGTVYIFDGTFSRSHNARNPDEIPTFEELGFPLGFPGMCRIGGSPNDDGLNCQHWIAVDRSTGPYRGSVYVLALVWWLEDPEEPIQGVGFSASTDGGVNWRRPIRIEEGEPDGIVRAWFPMISVAPNGRIDVVWNDNRSHPWPLHDATTELMYAFSEDGGVTWSSNVSVSPIFDPQLGYPAESHKLGDYYTMVSDNLGVNVAYAATFNGEQDVYFLRIGPFDCNGNEVPDKGDITAGTSLDCNANGIPDDCELPLDTDGDSWIDLFDAATFFNCLGDVSTASDSCCARFDADHDNAVTLDDYPGFRQAFVED